MYSKKGLASFRCARVGCGFVATLVAMAPQPSHAVEGGVSYWVPGFFGSLAATPQQPGFAFATVFYHPSVDAGADVAFARQVTRGRLNANFTGNLNIDLNGRADLVLLAPGYTFAEPLLGGQANISVAVPVARSRGEVNAALSGAVGPFPFTISGAASDTVTGFGDMAPMFSLRWNAGVHNFMTYVATDITVGRYDPDRLANLGLGHTALDGGGAYTYFNPESGNEFSATLGLTYNFMNDFTQYKNGIDLHLDLGASHFVTKQWQIGAVAYVYQQLTCDSGAGDRVGCFESRVLGIGPQIGYIFPIGEHLQGYFNLKGYKEFAEDHRAADWNVWLTFAISPAAPTPPATQAPMVRK